MKDYPLARVKRARQTAFDARFSFITICAARRRGMEVIMKELATLEQIKNTNDTRALYNMLGQKESELGRFLVTNAKVI